MPEHRETWESDRLVKRIAIEIEPISVEHEWVSPGDLAVRRGNQARATDDDAGQVDEFLVDWDT